MDGYMFFGQKLQSRVMNRKEVHPQLFKGANRVFKKVPWKKLEVERHNKEVDEELAAKRTKTAEKRDKARKDRIKEAGIDYEFSPTNTSAPASKKKKPVAAAAVVKGKKKAVAKKQAPAVAEEIASPAPAPAKKALAKAPVSEKTKLADKKQPVSPAKRVTRSRAAAVVAGEHTKTAAKKTKIAAKK